MELDEVILYPVFNYCFILQCSLFDELQGYFSVRVVCVGAAFSLAVSV